METLKYQRNKKLLELLDYSSRDLTLNKELMENFGKLTSFQPKTINWFIPYFERAYGGIFTILRFAEYFHTQKKTQNRLVICGDKDSSMSDVRRKIVAVTPGLSSQDLIPLTDGNVEGLPPADACIATQWTTAYPLLKFKKTTAKFYFIQDYEPLFYPAGFIYGLAEATYRFGFHAIINTPGLYDEYTSRYKSPAQYFIPSVDNRVFFPPQKKTRKPSAEKPFTIFFYGRPSPRNGFELGIVALKKIKREKGKQVRIYTAGSGWNQNIYDPEADIINLGMLPYEKTGDLYRKCDAGLFFMFTPHTSYIPFELMACGCPVVTNFNSANGWFLKENVNCILTQPNVSSVYEGITTLMDGPSLCDKLSTNGIASVNQVSWQDQIEKIYNFICK